jgi:hypothetical protein
MNDQRGTGRTTTMLKTVVETVVSGQSCMVVGATMDHCETMRKMLIDLAG